MMMISSLLIVAVVVLAVGRVEKSTVLFHAFHRPVFHFPEFTIPKPELTLQSDLTKKSGYEYAAQKTEKLPGGMFQLTGRVHFRGHFIQGRIFRVRGFLQHHRWKDQSGLDK